PAAPADSNAWNRSSSPFGRWTERSPSFPSSPDTSPAPPRQRVLSSDFSASARVGLGPMKKRPLGPLESRQDRGHAIQRLQLPCASAAHRRHPAGHEGADEKRGEGPQGEAGSSL